MPKSARTASKKIPSPPRRAERLSQEERREQLLVCAIRVFAEKGLVASNHALVAGAARVSIPTVFFYFPTREALVGAVLGEVERFYKAAMRSANDPGLPAEETLMAISKAMGGTLDTNPDYARILMEWSVAVRSEIWPHYLRLNRWITSTVAKVVERGQREGVFRHDLNPEDEAAILHATSSALIQLKETGASPARIDRFQRTILQSLLVQHGGKRSRG